MTLLKRLWNSPRFLYFFTVGLVFFAAANPFARVPLVLISLVTITRFVYLCLP